MAGQADSTQFTWSPIDSANTLTTQERQELALKIAREQREAQKEKSEEAYRNAQMTHILQSSQHQQAADMIKAAHERAVMMKDYYSQYATYVKESNAEAAKQYQEIVKALGKEGGLTARDISGLKYEGDMAAATLKGMELLSKRKYTNPEQMFDPSNKENFQNLYKKLSPIAMSKVQEFLTQIAAVSAKDPSILEKTHKEIMDRINVINMQLAGNQAINQGGTSRTEFLMKLRDDIYKNVPQYTQEGADAWVKHRMAASGDLGGGFTQDNPTPTGTPPGGHQKASSPSASTTVGGYIQGSDGKIQFVPTYGASQQDRSDIDKFNMSKEAQKAPMFMKSRGYDPAGRSAALTYFQKALNKNPETPPAIPPAQVMY